uniref:Neogenin C-terminal domain-containing protein n=1 Tax=Timema bartmani TaxID=61472 RepID=A0A7R9EYJ3_9NEOP|nr:unnamed protein product [Timema bartmani]
MLFFFFCTFFTLVSAPRHWRVGDDEKTSTARRVIKAKPIMLPVDSQPLRKRRKGKRVNDDLNGSHLTEFPTIEETIATATPLPSGAPQGVLVEPGGRPIYPRTQYTISRAHVTMDQAAQTPENPYSLQGGYDTVASLPPAAVSSVPPQVLYSTGMAQPGQEGGLTSATSKRHQGHPLKSFSVPAPPPQSAPGTPQPKHVVRPHGSSSPYKKTGLLASSSGAPPGGSTPSKGKGRVTKSPPTNAEDTSRIQPSYSTEELNQEMANLEGLMKDLNAITASEFEC